VTGYRRSAPEPEPLLPWWERYPHVFNGEMAEVRRLNATSRRPALCARFGVWDASKPVSADNPIRFILRGVVKVDPAHPGEDVARCVMEIDIGYPPNFPFDPPDVRPVDPEIARQRHQLGRSRELCYIQEELQPWRPGRGVEQTLIGAEVWFKGYVTGEWPDEVQAAELLAYLDTTSAHVGSILIPQHAQRSSRGATWGTFDLEIARAPRGPAVVGALRQERVRAGSAPARMIREVNDQLWTALDSEHWTDPVQGLWFRFDHEPTPFHDLVGLEQALQKAGFGTGVLERRLHRLVDRKAAQRGWVPIAIEYPTRQQAANESDEAQGTSTEWLFLSLEWSLVLAKGTTGTGGLRRAANRNPRPILWDRVRVKGIPSYDVSETALLRRVGEIYPRDATARAHVVIVGLGALGSTVALALAQVGIRRFTLVEHDIFKPGNAVRHELRFPSVGLGKANEIKKAIFETAPYAHVEVIHGTRGDDRAFERCILDDDPCPTLIISLTGNKTVDGQVDALAVASEPPIEVLHGWVYPHAQLLRAFLFRKGHTACTWCTELYRQDADEHQLGAYIKEPVPRGAAVSQPFFETGCATPTQPGAGNANALAAHEIVEHALDVLVHGRVPDDATHWVHAGPRVREVDPTYPLAPYAYEVGGFAPHPNCHLCSAGTLDADLSPEERRAFDAQLVALGAPVLEPPPARTSTVIRRDAA